MMILLIFRVMCREIGRICRYWTVQRFSPFAALSGYDSAVKEAMRLTEEQVDLDEDSKEALDQKLALLKECLNERPEVTITFFRPDDKKEGGAY